MDGVAYLGEKGEDGKFKPDSPKAFSFAMAGFKPKQRVRVIFEEYKETRSNRQNRYFWGVVVRAFCEYMGYRFANARDREFVKDQILTGIGHYELKMGLGGKEIKVVKGTHNLPAREFKEMVEACQELGAENGIVIADPESPRALGAKT